MHATVEGERGQDELFALAGSIEQILPEVAQELKRDSRLLDDLLSLLRTLSGQADVLDELQHEHADAENVGRLSDQSLEPP
jgi:hypothetical protein